MHSELATLDTIGGRPVLRFERRLRHSPDKVWKAITDPAEMTHWFPAKVETELRVGAEMRFVFPDEGFEGVHEGAILEFDPPKVYAFRWGDDVLRWEIVPDGSGCRLLFSHVISDADGGRRAAGRNAAGWDVCLAALSARLDGEPGEDEAAEMRRGLELTKTYVDRFGLDEGEVLDHPDGHLIRIERDLVWRPLEDAWALLTEHTEVASGAQPPRPATHEQVPAGPVTEAEPPYVLEYTWLHDGAPAGRVRWEFAADPKAGTAVVLTQTLPSHLAGLHSTVLAAWRTHLRSFFAAVLDQAHTPGNESKQA